MTAFIKNEFLSDPSEDITADTRMILSGLVDSFSLVSLQAFFETEFGKKVPAPKITPQSFDTGRQMVQIIQQF